MHTLFKTLVALLILSGIPFGAKAQTEVSRWLAALDAPISPIQKHETRVLHDTESSEWMSAVGRLIVSGKRCSLILVRSPAQQQAHLALTARHCLDRALMDKDNPEQGGLVSWQTVTGQFKHRQGGAFYRTLTVWRHGGSQVGADWAILSLSAPIRHDDAYAFVIDEALPDYQYPTEMALGHATAPAQPGALQGRRLSYDPECAFDVLLKATGGDVVRIKSCELSMGASGGAYVGFDGEHEEPILMGLLKGTRKDSPGQGYYVHLRTFHTWLQQALQAQKDQLFIDK